MIRAAGIDLGGTKSEIRLFGPEMDAVETRRDPVPQSYEALLDLLADQIGWARHIAGGPVAVGIGAAGTLRPDGTVVTANLPATGRPLPGDIAMRAGQPVSYLNDAQALALSEAVFGAGRGAAAVFALVLGTGVGGGFVRTGRLERGASLSAGEIGHISAPGPVMIRHGLTPRPCGCGRTGCIETLLSGPGMTALSEALINLSLGPEDIAAQRDGKTAPVWQVWRDVLAETLRTINLVTAPDCVVLAGGLAQIPELLNEINRSGDALHLPGLPAPRVVLAEAGDASGARGAAQFALTETGHD